MANSNWDTDVGYDDEIGGTRTRNYLAYPRDSAKDPFVVVTLDGDRHTAWQIQTAGAKLLRKVGHDIEPDAVDFHSV